MTFLWNDSINKISPDLRRIRLRARPSTIAVAPRLTFGSDRFCSRRGNVTPADSFDKIAFLSLSIVLSLSLSLNQSNKHTHTLKPTMTTTNNTKDDNGTAPSPSSRWYFAIGSMMNPVSLSRRGLVPKESHPARLLDFRLSFFGLLGVAEAIPEVGSSFHGVVHLMDEKDIAKLDNIERDYTKLEATAELYGNGIPESAGTDDSTKTISKRFLTVFCYGRPGANVERNATVDRDPSERYIQIMVEGCRHFGVDPSYIEYLQNHPQLPRATPERFQVVGKFPMAGPADDDNDGNNTNNSFESPNDAVYTLQQVQDMFQQGRAVMTFQEKVIEFVADDQKDNDEVLRAQREIKHMTQHHGLHGEIQMSNLVYDPKYEKPECLEACSREYAGYCEDLFVTYWTSTKLIRHWKVLGKFVDQQYRDDVKDNVKE